MTTLIGIKAEKGKKAKQGVVLASDLSRTQTKWTAQGDVAYRQQTKSEGQKIHVDDAGRVAICMSGIYDQGYVDFLSAILEGDIDVRSVVEKGYFETLRNLNLSRWNGEIPNNELMNGLLLATRFDNKPELYTCYPLGKVETRQWAAIGSGSDYAAKHITGKGVLIPRGLELGKGIDLTVESLNEASQDIYTGGLDLVVVTSRGIREFGSGIKKAVDSAKEGAIRNIKARL